MGGKKNKILVLNTGSSSIKFSLYSIKDDALLFRARIERLGEEDCDAHLVVEHAYKNGETVEESTIQIKDVESGIPFILDYLKREEHLHSFDDIFAVVHRVVHGADKYSKATLITPKVIEDIDSLSHYAPLHNPHNLLGIKISKLLLPNVPNVAVFDTAFHHTMKPEAYLYGISQRLYKEHGLRKYGFHGTNHKYCSLAVAEITGKRPERLITCHLGNGSSITAIKNGESIDTSMGFTPTDGVIMGTRSGAIDPEAVLFLQRELHKTPDEIDQFLNKESGLKAIAGTEDLRDIHRRAEKGDESARLALTMLSYHVAQYIGGYSATLGGLDCLVFTAGIGEHAWYIREAICKELPYLGVHLDKELNRENALEITLSTPGSITTESTDWENEENGDKKKDSGVDEGDNGERRNGSADGNSVRVFIIPANEELQMAREARELLLSNT